MDRRLALITLSAAAFAPASFALAQGADPMLMPKSDSAYRVATATVGTLSLEASRVAMTKASNADVKQFAMFEAAEQEAISAVLKELNTPAPKLDAKMQKTLADLNAASGAEFDRAYLKAQLEGHQMLQQIQESFIKEAMAKHDATDTHSRHIATVALPTIRQHIAMVQKMMDMKTG